MVDAAIERQLVACLNELPVIRQREVLEFARNLQSQSNGGVPGKELLRFAGTIESDDLDIMSAVISAGCERIDADEW